VSTFPTSSAPCSSFPASGASRWSLFVGGSRHLAPSPLVGQVLAAAVSSGCCVVQVGCCVGADAQALAWLAGQPPALGQVFAAFGPGAAGSCSLSAVPAVLAAAAAGASVTWWAGGGAAVPLRARLIRRSAAALRGASVALFFSPGAGSLAVAALAVRAGLPVWAIAPAAPAPVPGCAGAWVAGLFCGFLAWSWLPAGAAVQPSLF